MRFSYCKSNRTIAAYSRNYISFYQIENDKKTEPYTKFEYILKPKGKKLLQ